MSNNLLGRLIHDSNGESSETANVNERHWSDIVVYILGGALFLFTVYFSWRFLDRHAGAGTFALIPVLGVCGIDVAFLAWLMALVHGAKSREQKWIATAMTAISFVGMVATAMSENAGTYIPPELTPLIVFYVYGVVMLNVLCAGLYHVTDPANIASRKQRMEIAKLQNERREAENTLERERMRAENSQRILDQREKLIDLEEQQANQYRRLDSRKQGIQHTMTGGDLLNIIERQPEKGVAQVVANTNGNHQYDSVPKG